VADEILTERKADSRHHHQSPGSPQRIQLGVTKGLADAMDELDATPELSVAIVTGQAATSAQAWILKAFVAGENVSIPGRGIGFTEHAPQTGHRRRRGLRARRRYRDRAGD